MRRSRYIPKTLVITYTSTRDGQLDQCEGKYASLLPKNVRWGEALICLMRYVWMGSTSLWQAMSRKNWLIETDLRVITDKRSSISNHSTPDIESNRIPRFSSPTDIGSCNLRYFGIMIYFCNLKGCQCRRVTRMTTNTDYEGQALMDELSKIVNGK